MNSVENLINLISTLYLKYSSASLDNTFLFITNVALSVQ